MRIVETVSGSVTSTKQFINGEERDGSGNVTKQFFSRGQRNGSTNYFYAKDHLGSVRSMADNSGAAVSDRAFDSFGNARVINESETPDFGYAGMYVHGRSGLNLTTHRAYSASLSRWLSRDPLSEAVSGNLYSYVSNNPVNAVDPSGLLQILGVEIAEPFTPYVNALVNSHPEVTSDMRKCVINRLRHSIGSAKLSNIYGNPVQTIAGGVGFEGFELEVGIYGTIVGSLVNISFHDTRILRRSSGNLNEWFSKDTLEDLDADVVGALWGNLPTEFLIQDAIKKCKPCKK